MMFKRIVLTFMSVIFMLTVLNVNVSAAKGKMGVASPMYEIAVNSKTSLSLLGNKATCCSNANGTKISSIQAEQTLQKSQGTTWTAVHGANWTSTVNSCSISLENTKSNLSSGTYRLKTVFTLTDTNGKTETVTVYSDEKTVA